MNTEAVLAAIAASSVTLLWSGRQRRADRALAVDAFVAEMVSSRIGELDAADQLVRVSGCLEQIAERIQLGTIKPDDGIVLLQAAAATANYAQAIIDDKDTTDGVPDTDPRSE